MAIKRHSPPYGFSATGDGHLVLRTPNEPVTNTDLKAGEIAFSLDCVANKLVVRCREIGGTLMCALITINPA